MSFLSAAPLKTNLQETLRAFVLCCEHSIPSQNPWNNKHLLYSFQLTRWLVCLRQLQIYHKGARSSGGSTTATRAEKNGLCEISFQTRHVNKSVYVLHQGNESKRLGDRNRLSRLCSKVAEPEPRACWC